MRAGWIIPDRMQSGVVSLVRDAHIAPLHTILDLKRLPRALTLGIPEELFVPGRSREVFFCQLARLGGGQSVFTASMEAGKDIGERTVVLTLLLELSGLDQLRANALKEISPPVSEIGWASKLQQELLAQLDDARSPVASMLHAVDRLPGFTTFASEELRRSANRPDWMKKKNLFQRIVRMLKELILKICANKGAN